MVFFLFELKMQFQQTNSIMLFFFSALLTFILTEKREVMKTDETQAGPCYRQIFHLNSKFSKRTRLHYSCHSFLLK